MRLTIDTASPQTTIDTAPPSFDGGTNPSFELSSSDAGSSFECSIDGIERLTCSSPQNYGPLPDGNHEFEVQATDPAGNSDPTAASFTWVVDTAPPAAPSLSSPADAALLNDGTPTFNGTAEPGSTVTVLINDIATGTATADPAGNWSLTLADPLPDGTHSVRATSADRADNTGASSADTILSIDTIAPNGSVLQQAGTDASGAVPAFIIEADDETASISCSTDGGTVNRDSLLRFRVTSERFALARVTVPDGKRKLSSQVRAMPSETRLVEVKIPNLDRYRRLTVRLGVILFNNETATTQFSMRYSIGGGLSSRMTRVHVRASTTASAASTFTIRQHGRTISRKVFVLHPATIRSFPVRLNPGRGLSAGSATMQVSTFSADGARIESNRRFTIR